VVKMPKWFAPLFWGFVCSIVASGISWAYLFIAVGVAELHLPTDVAVLLLGILWLVFAFFLGKLVMWKSEESEEVKHYSIEGRGGV
jgi:fatty acid desaturase